MIDRKGNELREGDAVRWDVNGRWYKGTVARFAQVGTQWAHAVVRNNHRIGFTIDGEWFAGVWPRQIERLG